MSDDDETLGLYDFMGPHLNHASLELKSITREQKCAEVFSPFSSESSCVSQRFV